MNAVTPFLFEGTHIVRTVEQAGAPWFVAMDVCRVLELEKHRDAIAKLDSDERGSVKVDTPGGFQDVAAVNESGLYTLILRSRKAMTPGTVQHRFRKWVTAEVLPTIRKTGGYGRGRPAESSKREAVMLMEKLKVETTPAIRRTLHAMLHETLTPMGVETPPLEAIGHEAPPPPDILGPFWREVMAAEARGAVFNHAIKDGLLALRLPDLRGLVSVPLNDALRQALRQSDAPRFVAYKAVASAITGRSVKCWVFSR